MAYTNPFAPKMQDPTVQQNPYDMFREQAKQRGNANLNTGLDAMKRRFAQIGGGPSGAQMKMEQNLMNTNNQAVNDQINQINAQEAQQQVGLNEAGQQRDFQNKVFGFEQETKRRALDQADRQSKLDEQGQFFNQAMSALQSNITPDRFRDEIANFVSYLDKQVAGQGSQYTPVTAGGDGGGGVGPGAAGRKVFGQGFKDGMLAGGMNPIDAVIARNIFRLK